jgi:two-component system sensor histidine kinase PilS (NtrC family)
LESEKKQRTRGDSLVPAASVAQESVAEAATSELGRRLTYLMAFRVLIISLVLGATTLLYWLGDDDLTQLNSLIIYGIIGSTYVLTLVYARLLKNTEKHQELGKWQIVGDLVIASLLVHITGGVQSAYTFFYPLAIIGSAVVLSRRSAIIVALTATFLFVSVAYLGWISALPTPAGQRFLPSDPTSLEFSRAIALNLAAIASIGAMAVQLAAQLQKSSAALEEHRSVTADLLTLHDNIVRCLTSGLITVDSDSRILTINEAARDILALDAGLVVGDKLSDLAPRLSELLASSRINEEALRGEVTHKSDSGDEIVLGVSISPLFDHRSQTVGRIVNFQDLTEVRALEEKIKQGERLAVIGTLAAGIAHEIRNPLASISGSIELLGAAPSEDEDSSALMEIVTREIGRLNELLTDLLAYANPRPPKMIELDICEVIQDTLRVFAQNTEFGEVEAEFEGAEDRPSLFISADPEQIRQMIWNLLRNGAEAAAKGGKKIWVSAETAKNEVVLRFRDNGAGIPGEYLAKVFDPFFTTKAHGTGLGLAMVQGMVTDHGGSISVDSEVDKGTTFELRFPYHSEHVS